VKALLCSLLVLLAAPAAAKGLPGVMVVASGDTALAYTLRREAAGDTVQVPGEDTLRISVNVGDTVSVELWAVNWPTVTGYYMTVQDLHFQPKVATTAPLPFVPIDYLPGSFLAGPDLPTTAQGIVFDSGVIQIGLASLGERQDFGSGLLGTFRFETAEAFEDSLDTSFYRAYWSAPADSADITGGAGAPIRVVLRIGNLPPPAEPVTADFDKSGMVDFKDFLLFAIAFQEDSAGRAYSQRFDLALNQRIDFNDFLLFASHFGKAPQVIR